MSTYTKTKLQSKNILNRIELYIELSNHYFTYWDGTKCEVVPKKGKYVHILNNVCDALYDYVSNTELSINIEMDNGQGILELEISSYDQFDDKKVTKDILNLIHSLEPKEWHK